MKGGVAAETVMATLPRIAKLSSDANHKFMATFHNDDDVVRVFVKGAPDVLPHRCSDVASSHGEVQLDEGERERINGEYKRLAAGLRGLRIASQAIPLKQFDSSSDRINCIVRLNFVGLVGLLGPPRPEAKPAIAQCQAAAILVKVIMGDHKDTAAAIARELGLPGNVLSGVELEQMSDGDLVETIEAAAVIARVTAAHKVRIVGTLQAKVHVVAMTGDDAAALKSADIGVAQANAHGPIARVNRAPDRPSAGLLTHVKAARC
jgi:Ca2+-transporting ATPase